jgi:hypothetical protein
VVTGRQSHRDDRRVGSGRSERCVPCAAGAGGGAVGVADGGSVRRAPGQRVRRAHAGSGGDAIEWLLSLVAWGGSVAVRRPDPNPVPPLDPDDPLSFLRTGYALLERSRRQTEEGRRLIAQVKAAQARDGA